VRNYYTLIIANNSVGIYGKAEDSPSWENILINGEVWTAIHSQDNLTQLIRHFNDDLNLTDNLKDCSVVVLYEKKYIHFLESLSETLSELQCNDWQVLGWEMIAQRSSTIKPIPAFVKENWDQAWITTIAMPTLESILNYQGQAWESELNRVKAEHEETKEDLRRQRLQLEQELEQLRKQIKAVQQPDMEYLLTYMPIIYRNFWMSIKPNDLSLLAGTYTVPNIPSPYPEPDSNTIAMMKKRLQNLPESELQKIKNFCQEMTHRLNIRPEMKFILED